MSTILEAMNEYCAAFQLAIDGCGEPPPAPDLEGLPAITLEQAPELAKLIERCQALSDQAQAIQTQTASAMSPPRLVRSESLDVGRTLFADI